jgi:hypothetical protein
LIEIRCGMLTFVTTAKPFLRHDSVIQRNALKSWTLLRPDVEVILFGDDAGAADARCTRRDVAASARESAAARESVKMKTPYFTVLIDAYNYGQLSGLHQGEFRRAL